MVTDLQDAARKALGDRPDGVPLAVYRMIAGTLAGVLALDTARRGEIEGLRKRLEGLEAKDRAKKGGKV